MQQQVDWDALLRSAATETAQHTHLSDIQLGQLAEGIENLEGALPPGVVEGSTLAPGLRDVRLAEVIAPVIQGQEASTLNVAQCLDLWSRGLHASEANPPGVVPQQQGQYYPPMAPNGCQQVIQGSVLNIQLEPFHGDIDEGKDMGAVNRAERQRKRKEKQEESVRRKMSAHASGSDMVPIPTGVSSSQITDGTEDTKKSNGPRRKRSVKSDERAMRNRESAARSRAKRLEYTHELEERVKTLKDVNKDLREKIIKLAKAPADPHGSLRRTRTMPL